MQIVPLRVLVVEDDWIQASEITEALKELNCEVLGPVSTMQDAFILLYSAKIDAGVTDLDLNGRLAIPFTRALRERGIPYAIISAYTPEFSAGDAPLLEKPCTEARLREFLAEFLKGVKKACTAFNRRVVHSEPVTDTDAPLD